MQSRIRRRRRATHRKGAMVILLVVSLIPLLAFVAFCIDIGWIAKTKSELQNAADAAASAGARQLAEDFAAYTVPSTQDRALLIGNAKQTATSFVQKYGELNGAGGVTSLSILQSDIQFGFTDANKTFNPASTEFPNTVQVIVRRDSSANSPLSLFFGSLFGKGAEPLTASATATVHTGLVGSLDPNGGGETSQPFPMSIGGPGSDFDCLLLPAAFDVNHWKTFVATGVSPDNVSRVGPDGEAQLQIYPSPPQATGNFGLLCVGAPTILDAGFINWVQNGPSASDLQYLNSNGNLPTTELAPTSWSGAEARTSVVSSFAGIIGRPRLLPLFQPVSSSPYQGASGAVGNPTYRIVGFVGVKVTSASASGVTVKPYGVVDPTAVFDSATVYPAGAQPSGQLQAFTFVGTKLTQ